MSAMNTAGRAGLRKVATLPGRTHFVEYLLQHPGQAYATVSEGQEWDEALELYYRGGVTIVELNDRECVTALYRMED